jgi:hypothetical protein
VALAEASLVVVPRRRRRKERKSIVSEVEAK